MEKAVAITRHCVASRLLRNDLLRGLLANRDEKHVRSARASHPGDYVHRVRITSKQKMPLLAGETGSHTEKAMSLHGDEGTIIVAPID